MKADDRGGYVWLTETTRDELEAVRQALSFIVPGREHMPLFKRGSWDGVKRFLDWRLKRFRRGLAGLVERKTGLSLGLGRRKAFLMPVLLSPDGKVFEDRAFQPASLAALLGHGLSGPGGIAKLATNAGKTAVIAGVVKAMHDAGVPVVVFERMEDLLVQVKKEIEDWSGLRIGEWSARMKEVLPVMVVMAQSASQAFGRTMRLEATQADEQIVTHLKAIGAVVIDECHHGGAESYERLLDLNPDSLRFGFSGTVPAEDDIDGVVIRALFGDVVAEVSNAELIAAGISARPTIHVVEYEVEGLEEKAKEHGKSVRAECFKVVGEDEAGRKLRRFSTSMYTARVREYAMNYAMRHDIRFWDAVKGLLDRHPGVSAAVLVDWVEFSEDLARHIGAEVLHGEVARGDRERILRGFSSGKIERVVATSVLDEGMSIDRIRVLVLANAGSSTRQFLQRVGRGLRKKLDDNTLTVYCFAMYGHKYLLGPSKERLKIWRNEGFEIVFDGEESCTSTPS